MFRFFVCFLLLINVTPVFAATIRTTRPYYYNPYSEYYSTPVRDFNALEQYAMNRNYARENEIQRLERLENLAFGAVQNGDIATRFQQVENAILSRPRYNGYKNSFRNVLGNYIAGQTTGVTPSIINQGFIPNYNNMGFGSPQYMNSNMIQYSGLPFGGRGYQLFNQNHGTGSSIRILP